MGMDALPQKDQDGNTSGTAGQMNREQSVYVVDDDPAVRHALGIFLETESYSVWRAMVSRLTTARYIVANNNLRGK
jgi:hypothetical protein